jgi:NADPH:quinone reductase-like Zn-dependent oxidoreductase
MKDSQVKAIVYAKYGSPDVLQLQDVDRPVPNEDEVLGKVHATSLNAADSYGSSNHHGRARNQAMVSAIACACGVG